MGQKDLGDAAHEVSAGERVAAGVDVEVRRRRHLHGDGPAPVAGMDHPGGVAGGVGAAAADAAGGAEAEAAPPPGLHLSPENQRYRPGLSNIIYFDPFCVIFYEVNNFSNILIKL